jgi:hypothetical protein
MTPLAAALIERWLPQYSHCTERETYSRHISLMAWSHTPFLNRLRHELAKAQNAAGTWARTAELSGRGVPSRRQRSISFCMSGSICARST